MMNLFKPAAVSWMIIASLLGFPAQSVHAGQAAATAVEDAAESDYESESESDSDSDLDAEQDSESGKLSRDKSAKETIAVTLLVKASPESAMASTLDIRSPRLQKYIRKARPVTIQPEVLSDAYIELTENGVKRTYTVDDAYRLVSPDGVNSLELPGAAGQTLERYVQALRASHYGQMEDWSEAQKTAPLKTVVTVIDLETGLRFQAQRRAGKQHADVQPMTKQDTAVMKQIYGGEWSWKRRAIIVLANGKQLAGSMHGMPHGGDGIPGNDFSGHFCIHFLGSTTHGSGNSDPDHQLMIRKAAGQLKPFYAAASPEQLVQSFFVGVNARDPLLLRMAFAESGKQQLNDYVSKLPRILAADADMEKAQISSAAATESEITVKAVFSEQGSGMIRYTFKFKLSRPAEDKPWKIAAVTQTAEGKRKKVRKK